VVVGVLLSPDGPVSRMLGTLPLATLGRWSYGIYLWHWPIFLVLSPDRTGLEGVPLSGIRIAVTLGVAALSYHALEQPIRRGRVSGGWLVGGAVASPIVILVAALVSTQHPSTPGEQLDTESTTSIASPSNQLDVLLIGDSLSVIVAEEFKAVAREQGLRADVMGIEACGSLRATDLRYLSGHSFDLSRCIAYREEWVSEVAARRPKRVILLEGWSGEGSKKINGEWAEPCTPSFDEAYERDLADLTRQLHTSGSEVALVLTPAPLARDLASRYARLWGGRSSDALQVLFDERVTCQNDAKRSAAQQTSATLLDLQSRVCPRGNCQRTLGSTLLRSDGMHFDGPGGVWVSRWMLGEWPQVD